MDCWAAGGLLDAPGAAVTMAVDSGYLQINELALVVLHGGECVGDGFVVSYRVLEVDRVFLWRCEVCRAPKSS